MPQWEKAHSCPSQGQEQHRQKETPNPYVPCLLLLISRKSHRFLCPGCFLGALRFNFSLIILLTLSQNEILHCHFYLLKLEIIPASLSRFSIHSLGANFFTISQKGSQGTQEGALPPFCFFNKAQIPRRNARLRSTNDSSTQSSNAADKSRGSSASDRKILHITENITFALPMMN